MGRGRERDQRTLHVPVKMALLDSELCFVCIHVHGERQTARRDEVCTSHLLVCVFPSANGSCGAGRKSHSRPARHERLERGRRCLGSGRHVRLRRGLADFEGYCFVYSCQDCPAVVDWRHPAFERLVMCVCFKVSD